MKSRKVEIAVFTLTVVALVMVPESVFARDLVSAANTQANTVKNVAQALAVTGVVGGGAIMQLPGAGEYGKRVMVSGFVGCLCAFGAPAFMALMHTVFGG